MGNNCCVRAKNPQELEYGQGFDTQFGNPIISPKAELLNMQRSSINFKEAQKFMAIQMFDPSCHALPVALHHCITGTCTGLKHSIRDVMKISENYSQGVNKNFFDAKFLLSDYGVLEIQSKGSKCWDPAQLSKSYQIELQELKKQSFLSPYSSEVDSLVCIVRKKKQSFAFSFKLNSINTETQKQEFIIHTLFPHIDEGDSSTQSFGSSHSTHFKGFDCGELAFEDISEFYEYLDTLFEEDEDYSVNGIDTTKLSSQKSNDTTNDSQDKPDNFVFIQLIAYLQISRISNKSDTPYFGQLQMQQSSESFIDLLNTFQFDDSDDEVDQNKSTSKKLEKENQRCSYLSLKQNSRFSHRASNKPLDVLQTSKKQNQILNTLYSPIKPNNNIQPK